MDPTVLLILGIIDKSLDIALFNLNSMPEAAKKAYGLRVERHHEILWNFLDFFTPDHLKPKDKDNPKEP